MSNLGKQFNIIFKGRKYVLIAGTTTEASEWINLCNDTRELLAKKTAPKRETEVRLL